MTSRLSFQELLRLVRSPWLSVSGDGKSVALHRARILLPAIVEGHGSSEQQAKQGFLVR